VKEGSEVSLKLVEIGRHDGNAGVGKLDGVDVQVAGGGSLIGKRVRARVERVMDGTAYATLVSPAPRVEDPITAEDEAERPTRRRKAKAAEEAPEVAEAAAEEPVEEEEEEEVAAVADEAPPAEDKPKRKTRRGTRGGRGRKRKPAAAAATNGAAPVEDAPEAPAARIHLPPETLGEEEAEPESVNGGAEVAATDAGEEQPVKPKRKTRRGTRGGRNRKRKPAAASASTAEVPPEPTPE
jgi:ribonuclease E